jgi:hypothetical protein
MRILSAVIFAALCCGCGHTVTVANGTLCGVWGNWGHWAIDVPLNVVPCLLGIRIVPVSTAADARMKQCADAPAGAARREDGSGKHAMARPEECGRLPGDDASSAAPSAAEAGHE